MEVEDFINTRTNDEWRKSLSNACTYVTKMLEVSKRPIEIDCLFECFAATPNDYNDLLKRLIYILIEVHDHQNRNINTVYDTSFGSWYEKGRFSDSQKSKIKNNIMKQMIEAAANHQPDGSPLKRVTITGNNIETKIEDA